MKKNKNMKKKNKKKKRRGRGRIITRRRIIQREGDPAHRTHNVSHIHTNTFIHIPPTLGKMQALTQTHTHTMAPERLPSRVYNQSEGGFQARLLCGRAGRDG